MDIKDFFKNAPAKSQPKDWLVNELFRNNRINLSAGYPGDGKSLVNELLMFCIAYDANFADIFPVTHGNIMLIDNENEWGLLEERCTKIINGLEADGHKQVGKIDIQPSRRSGVHVLKSRKQLLPELCFFLI